MRFFLFIVYFGLLFFQLDAKEQVYTIGYDVGVVADHLEWDCKITEKRIVGLPNGNNNDRYVTGQSKNLPISFVFYRHPFGFVDIFKAAEDSLKEYAVKTGTVLFDIAQREVSNGIVVLEGEFFDSTSAGAFRYKIEKIGKYHYVMFTKIDSFSFDEYSRVMYFDSVDELITILYNPI